MSGESIPAQRPGVQHSSHLRGSTLLLAGRVAAMGLTVATQVLLVRALTKTDFGAFAFALAISSASRILLSLGQGRTLSRFLTIYDEREEYDKMFGALALVLLTITGTSLLLLVGFGLARGAIAQSLDAPETADILLILLFLAPLEAVEEALGALFAVFAKPMSIFVRRYVLTPGLRFAAVASLYALEGSAALLAVGYVLTSVVGLAVYSGLVVKLLRERDLTAHLRRRHPIRLPVRDIFAFSVPSLSADFLYLSMQLGSVALLAHYWTAAEVADYRAVFPAGRLNQFVYSTFAVLYLPAAARYFSRHDRSGQRDAYWHAALFLAVFSFPVFVMTVPFARATTVMLFGDRYSGAAIVLAVLSSGYYFNASLGFNWQTLQVLGRVRYMFTVNLACAALNLLAAVALVPHLGALGVAVANCATLVTQNVANQVGVTRALGTRFIARGYGRPYAIIAIAAALTAGVGVLVDPPVAVALAVAAGSTLVVLVLCRRELDMSGTFPELARVPLLRRVLR